jgi:hypothetical protein
VQQGCSELVLHSYLLFAPSWHTIIGIPTPLEIGDCPCHPERKSQYRGYPRLRHLLSTLHGGCCHCRCKTHFRLAGWLAFTGRELNPLSRYERFPSCYISSPLPGLILTLWWLGDSDLIAEPKLAAFIGPALRVRQDSKLTFLRTPGGQVLSRSRPSPRCELLSYSRRFNGKTPVALRFDK